MEAPIKKPKTKPKKPRKPRKPRKPSTGGTNITINVGTTAARKPRAKPKPRATQNTFPFRSPSAGGGGGGGVLPTAFPGQGDQFRQVIYTPQADVGGSIKALEKSIDNLSRSGGSQDGDRGRPPINFVGNQDDASQAGGNDAPAETTAEKRERMRLLRAGGLNPLASIPEGLSRSELNRRLSEESRTKQAQEQMLGQYQPTEQPPIGS